eukprot:CAMPEP_0115006634 /NCGR_PEP_ID=MMETSP0216-20121206/20623_1 /TAXON_ID=223996 /ORGANISM="Protocruzia adherens, Strain Boccale" /LENGTH=954 /DNA_ID=CAMNT_0002373267 /DNA_START=205 /DNA_END=3072 /DNA_ORIENTATION=-
MTVFATEADREREEKEVESEAKKMRISNFLTNHACACIGIMAVFLFIMLTLTAMVFEVNEYNDREYFVWDDKRTIRNDALQVGIEDVREDEIGDSELPLRIERRDLWTLYVLYHRSGNPVVTPQSLNTIRAVEQTVQENSYYKNLCWAKSETDSSCQPTLTFSTWFDPGATQDQINTKLQEVAQNQQTFVEDKAFFDRGYTASNPTPKWGRSMFRMGLPIDTGSKRYKSSTDDFNGQRNYFVDFLKDINPDVMDHEDNSDVDIYFFAYDWWGEKFNEYMMNDMVWVAGSMVFVFIYMMIHTWSVVLPMLGMVQVLSSFPIAYVIYRIIMQIVLFNMINMLSIFVILGIAADDIFVFMDAWKQSEQYACLADDLEKRVAYVYRRAAKAMFVTTITTFSAFLATAISDLAPISAFGIFSANLILANYFLVITLFPACVIVRHKILNRNKKQEPRKDSIPKETGSPKVYAGVPKENPQLDANKEADVEGNANSADVNVAVVATSPEAKVAQKPHLREESRVAVFLATKYFDKVTKARYFIMAFFAMWFIATLVMATQIEPLSENEKWVPSDSNVSEAFDAIQDTFHKGETDGFIKVNIVYGIDGLDRSDVRAYDVESIGDVEWDNNFDLSPKANQERMIEVCSLVKNSPLVQDQIIECFMADFKTWITNDGADSTAFPVEPSQFHTKMREYLKGPGYEHQAQNRVGYVGNRMRYAVIYTVAVGKMEVYEYMYPRWEDWEDFAEEINKNSPAGMNNAYQTSTMWQFMIAERALVRNAIQGMLIAGSISFVVLIMSTLNLVLAVYAITAIIGIVISVLAFAFMLGWEFGMVVAIAVVILIGFSVDYAVHICHAYVESQAETRAEKTRDALRKMGISILGGAITTFGTGAILFLTTLVFFQRFAWVISATIIFAVMWAMVFLPALLIICGPQGETGNLKVWYFKLKAKIAASRGKKNGNN